MSGEMQKRKRDNNPPRGGLLSLFLFCISPDIRAHGSLFTTDLGAAAFFFFALYALRKLIVSTSLSQALWTGFLLGLALLTKISALLLIPIFFILCVVAYL